MFVFFGLVATVGSAYVQIERITAVAVVAAIPVGLLATALLVVNNLRDIPTDATAGKRTLAVRLGDKRTRWLYVACSSSSRSWCCPSFGALGRPARRARVHRSRRRATAGAGRARGGNRACADPGPRCDRSLASRLRCAARRRARATCPDPATRRRSRGELRVRSRWHACARVGDDAERRVRRRWRRSAGAPRR